MMFAYLIKARPKAGKPNLFTWFDSKSDSRADREIMNILEDNEIETGRGADYMLPVRTNVPVLDDLPEENALDETWCDRYELADDNITWKKIVAAEPAVTEPAETEAPAVETQPEPEALSNSTPTDKDLVVDANDDDLTEYPVAEMAFGRRLLSQLICDATAHHIKHAQRVKIIEMSLDTDNSYVQNLLLTAIYAPGLEGLSTAQLWKYTHAIKTVFPMDKRHELARVVQFSNLWLTTEHIDRGILVREWAKGNYISTVQRTESGATAGGGNKTDRNPDLNHTLDTLDEEIACALLSMDFDIYNIPGGIHRRAKEMIANKESPWKEWSRKMRNTPGALDYSRAANFAVIRSAAPNIHMMPGTHQAWINAKLTETDHANPSAETLALAMRSTVLNSTTETSTDAGSEQVQDDVTITSAQPEIKRISSTVFSIEGLMGSQNNDNPVINIESNEVESVETNQPSIDDVNKQLAAARGEFVEGISDPNDPKWVHEELSKATSNEVEKQEIKPEENASDEQMETTDSNQIAGSAEIPAGEGVDADGEEVAAVDPVALTSEEEKQSAQSIAQLQQRIERLESALVSLGNFFTAPVEVA